MGQSHQESQKHRQLLSKLNFIQNEKSQIYGDLVVYRITEKPFDYYLRYREIYQNSPASKQIIQNSQELYQSLESHRNIVKVESMHVEKSIQFCSDAITFDCLAKYYNYTLENSISNKRNSNKMFKDADLLYILFCLVDVGMRVSEYCSQIYLGIFKAQKIYLSTEGFLKMYPFKLHQEARCQLISSSDITHSHQGAPFKESFSYSSHLKSDLKDIGFLVTQLILLEQQSELKPLSKEHIFFRLDKLVAGKISPRLRFLTMRLIGGQEMSWGGLKKQVEAIRVQEGIIPSYCLRLEEDISLKESQILEREQRELAFKKAERQSKLLAMQPNLVPSKIEPLSRQKQL